MIKLSIALGTIIFFIEFSFSFNISPLPNLIHSKPFTRETDPSLRERPAYFGFSLLLRQRSILISAPRANSTLGEQSALFEPGVLYRCSVEINESCEVFDIDSRNNIENNGERFTEIRGFQWLGATISGDQNDNTNNFTFITCAPMMRTRIFRLTVGACYICENDITPCLPIKKPFIYAISQNIQLSLPAIATYGFSSHWIKDRKLYLVGAPTKNLKGAYVLNYLKKSLNPHDAKTVIEAKFDQTYNDANLGYSVSAGDFDVQKKVSYIISAPKYLYFGTVLVIQENSTGNNRIFLKGSQQFEYFGYCVIMEDLNNDGISDIIVSAPLYSEGARFEIGAIYIYNGRNLRSNIYQIIVSPSKLSRGKFGYSLAALGDINLDGYNDIAVGAPFLENGKVFIYHGNSNGLSLKPVQILEAPKFVETSRPHYFGHSISGRIDVDGNGINDIVISAINIDKIYLFKTYKIINVDIFFENFSTYLRFTETNTTIRTCIRFSGYRSEFKKSLKFDLILKLDRFDNRIKFDDGLSEKRNMVNLTSDEKQCFDHSISIEHNDNVEPFRLELNYEHIQKELQENFCENCAVIYPEEVDKRIIEELFIAHTCQNGVCNSNLKVEIITDAKILIENSDRYLNVSVEITNFMDEAYLPRLIITNNENLPLIQVPPACSERNSILTCNLWNDKLFLLKDGQMKTFYMSFDISNLEGSELIIEAKASSRSNEADNTDNTAVLHLNISRCSEVEIIETSGIESQYLNFNETELEENIYLQKTFEIQNLGPSHLKDVIFVIQYPILSEGYSSPIRPLNYDFVPVFSNDNLKLEKLKSTNKFWTPASLKSGFSNICGFTELENFDNLQHEIAQNISSNDKIVFDSDDSEFEELQIETLILEKFMSGKKNAIKATINLDINQKKAWDLLEGSAKKSLIYKINFFIADKSNTCTNPSICEMSSINFRHKVLEFIIIKTEKKNLAWIYASSFFAAVLVYLIIALLLYKIGFFKRKKHKEVQKFKRESLKRQASEIKSTQQTSNNIEDDQAFVNTEMPMETLALSIIPVSED